MHIHRSIDVPCEFCSCHAKWMGTELNLITFAASTTIPWNGLPHSDLYVWKRYDHNKY